MKWPLGKYNGQRIGGIRITVELNFAWWVWAFKWNFCSHYLHIGPIHIWEETAYEKRSYHNDTRTKCGVVI
jgi:hypothetical protein